MPCRRFLSFWYRRFRPSGFVLHRVKLTLQSLASLFLLPWGITFTLGLAKTQPTCTNLLFSWLRLISRMWSAANSSLCWHSKGSKKHSPSILSVLYLLMDRYPDALVASLPQFRTKFMKSYVSSWAQLISQYQSRLCVYKGSPLSCFGNSRAHAPCWLAHWVILYGFFVSKLTYVKDWLELIFPTVATQNTEVGLCEKLISVVQEAFKGWVPIC